MVQSDNQRQFDDEEIHDGELRENLILQLRRWQTNQEGEDLWKAAHKQVVDAKKKIKGLLPLDGQPHRYVLDDCVIEITAERPGGHREFDASARQDVKIKRVAE
jgi:hypothetical protein